ncbi:helix-turn-helix domain-containing protein [Pseudarthrobacter sp. MDT3-1]
MNDWKDYQHANCCPCHTTRKIAYTIEEAAARVGLSSRTLRDQIADNYLLARYFNSKALITHEDLVAWINRLPTEAK